MRRLAVRGVLWGISCSSLAAAQSLTLSPWARHEALGGAAQAGGDAASLLTNPAGLAAIETAEVAVGASLELTRRSGAPFGSSPTLEAEPSFGTRPALALGVRLDDWLRVGVGAFVRRNESARYEGGGVGASSLALVEAEATPGIALVVPEEILPGKLSLGVGYRFTAAWLQGSAETTQDVDVSSSGFDARGVRVGLQYSPLRELRLGATFLSGIGVDVADGSARSGDERVEARVRLDRPPELAAGARFDFDRFGIAADYAVVFTGELERAVIELGDAAIERPLEFSTGHSARFGVEYRVAISRHELPLRLGYRWESAITSARYPTAFGEPPAPAHAVTCGLGYRTRDYEIHAAGFYRASSASVAAGELGPGCSSCGGSGDYGASRLGFSLDFSTRFEL